MSLTRRDFIRMSGFTLGSAIAGGAVLSGCGKESDKLAGSTERTNICPGCDMACGIIVSEREGRIINVRGNPDHPVNAGSICPKGSALRHMAENRLDYVLHRKPNSSEWEKMTRDEAFLRIAELVKETRDRTFAVAEKNVTVNTCTGIAAITGGFLSNEEYYLWNKFFRILGVTALGGPPDSGDMASATGLSSTFGYGAMTNTWNDLCQSDVVFIIGADPVNSHPVSMRHIQRGRKKGALIINVDPRFTRTSSCADIHVGIRPGTDIAFINGVINYALTRNRIHREYVVEYTNASFLLDPAFSFKDGFFSGFNPRERTYDRSTWKYFIDEKGIPRRDRTLKDGNSVYQHLAALVSRYTPDEVSRITGCSTDVFVKAAEIITSSGTADRAGSVIFGAGITGHSTGTQTVRALSILQLLLGNIGQRGGGMAPLNRFANSQGMRDQGPSRNFLPGFLEMPRKGRDESLDTYRTNHMPKSNDSLSANEGQKTVRYLVSMLRAWYGDRAVADNDFAYAWLPRVDKPLTPAGIIDKMASGGYEGAFMLDIDTVAASSKQEAALKGLEKLSWLICTDLRENRTSGFWKREGVKPGSINTEVFLIPSASPLEIEGSITSGSRLVQWREPSVKSSGDVIPGVAVIDNLFKKIRNQYTRKGGVFPDPVLSARWNYTGSEEGSCDIHMIAREINGFDLINEKQIPGDHLLRDDGSTLCGNRLYCGSYPDKKPLMARTELKKKDDPDLYKRWGWSWPDNTRILYNRASVDVKGNPWSPSRTLVKWKGNVWTGDNPDGQYPPGSKYPFTYLAEGAGRIFSPVPDDGPFPEHYEPFEAPVITGFPGIRINPLLAPPSGWVKKYSCAVTLFASGECQSPVKSPWLDEMSLGSLCEISTELAVKKNLSTGDTVRITSARGSVTARLLVTARIKPLVQNNSIIDVIHMAGPDAIRLVPDVYDPSSGAGESHAFMADIDKA